MRINTPGVETELGSVFFIYCKTFQSILFSRYYAVRTTNVTCIIPPHGCFHSEAPKPERQIQVQQIKTILLLRQKAFTEVSHTDTSFN